MKLRNFRFLGVALFLAACAVPSRAATITVTNLNDSGAGSLRQALINAVENDAINFQSGLSGTIALNSELVVDKKLTITGPGAANLALSGNFVHRIFNVRGSQVSISGLKVFNGATNADDGGGGILVGAGNFTGAGLTLSNCILSNNVSENSGGAISTYGSLTVNTCTFSSNTASDYYGGAIDNQEGVLTVTNSTFTGNIADAAGGAINSYANAGTVSVTNCTFSTNSCENGGKGGAVNTEGRMVVTNCKFAGNITLFDGGGGAIRNRGSLIVDTSTFTSNQADRTYNGGGAVYSVGSGSSLTILASTFDENRGSSIYLFDAGTSFIKNSTITGGSNTNYGGGITIVYGSTTIINCTIANNSSTTAGGGIRFGGGGTVNLLNTIVSGNTSGEGPDLSGTINSQDYNLIQNPNGATISGSTSHNILYKDPLLAPLADNGGPTKTMALQSGSRAIDQGVSGGLTTDQRGSARPYDNPAVGNVGNGDGSDIGAYEAQKILPSFSINDVTIAEKGGVNTTATFTVTLSEAVNSAVSVQYATANGTATVADYTATSGTLNFAANETSKTITVPILADQVDENNENFFVNLSNATGVGIGDAQGKGVITDAPTIYGNVSYFRANPVSLGQAKKKPFADVTVQLGTSRTTVTDSLGNFSFPGVANGSYLITPQPPQPGVQFAPTLRSINVTGEDVTSVNFKSYVIVGRVYRLNAKGMKFGFDGALVKIGDTIRASTDAQGFYSILYLGNGNYKVTAEYPGFTFPTKTVTLPTSGILNVSPNGKANFQGTKVSPPSAASGKTY